MSKKIRVGLLFGGRSAEHEISILSARNVYEAIDREKYEVTLIGIDKEGRWCLKDEAVFLLKGEAGKLPALAAAAEEAVTLLPHESEKGLISVVGPPVEAGLDVVFPLLHGTYGEDGTMQGLLDLASLPYVGCGVLSSSACMDKDVAKRLMLASGISVARYQSFKIHEKGKIDYTSLSKELGEVLFVKPANAGSSVGVRRISSKDQLAAAVEEAFLFDTKILIEEAVSGRELECAVLGNDEPRASAIGEILPSKVHGFYSYDAKYIDESGAETVVPAELQSGVAEVLQKAAIKTFQALECTGMARVDFFLKENGEAVVNEVNTIPGFTSISMYPKMWEASGIGYSDLIDQLIQLAISRYDQRSKIKTTYDD